MFKQNLNYRFMFATTVAIVLIMTVNFTWDYYEQKRQSYQELREKAQVITKQLLATREFIAQKQDRINFDSQGHFEFKGLNPAAVGRGLGDIFASWTEYGIKQTRLEVRNPKNAPDEYEKQALYKFQADPALQEVWGEDTLNGRKVFRYIVPLRVNESCLPCHGEPAGSTDIAGYPKEGYKYGGLAGAISITVPMDIFISNLRSDMLRHFGFIFVLLGVTLAAIYVLLNRLVASPLSQLKKAAAEMGSGNLNVDLTNVKAVGEIKELAMQFQDMALQLSNLYGNMEQQVETRTRELQLANEVLKAKQQELEKANLQLAQANEHKSRFLATMSHELRTPLTSIIAFTELLLENMDPEDGLSRQNLQEIKVNGENLLNLINNLLDLAKIEAGRYQLNLETVDMVDVIGSVERVIAPLAMKKGIDFKTRFMEEIPLLKADPEKIHRVVENLAGNAVKFTPQGGKVEIKVDFDRETQTVLVEVNDTGIGIKEEDQERIFERFVQVDNSNSRRYRGTGLGLALAKELVEMHGGWIRVSSRPEEGSAFTVGLPVAASLEEGKDG
ncbi:c-type heme family protein [Zhaonella formicivorans]|uniref:ATP-binding protein n=1 Tax=Zhaonella formicivorans TaxID=2528593 RepID=UPI001D1068E6|nr:DUF3365 domain-containing protein [Zhaonella formicivorans]